MNPTRIVISYFREREGIHQIKKWILGFMGTHQKKKACRVEPYKFESISLLHLLKSTSMAVSAKKAKSLSALVVPPPTVPLRSAPIAGGPVKSICKER